MSNNTNKDLYIKPQYMQNYVGGNQPPSNKQYMNNQLELIRQSKQKVPPINFDINQNQNGNTSIYRHTNNQNSVSNKYQNNSNNNGNGNGNNNGNNNGNSNNNNNQDIIKKALYTENEDVINRYDPYAGYLYEKGLLYDGNNKRRFKTNYLHIDSRNRVQVPTVTIDTTYKLTNNPLSFNEGSNIITINHQNSGYTNGSLITITGVGSTNATLKTFINNNSSMPSFYIPQSSNILGINGVNHGIPITSITYQVLILLTGIMGDDVNTNGSFLGNIPINSINAFHQIYSTINTTVPPVIPAPPTWYDPNIYAPDVFYIILPLSMNIPYILSNYNYKIFFQTLNGIDLNLINANFPINPSSLQGYQTIQNVSSTGYTITLNENALGTVVGGGNNINVSLIKSVNSGYPNPNKYSVILNKAYHDVISVKLISIEFPNSERTITNENDKQNNKIYWNNLEDGSYIYSLEVPPGNYSPCDLEKILEKLFYDTPRIYADQSSITYEPNQYVKVEINNNTDQVTFKSYKKFILSKPFIAPIGSNTTQVIQPIVLTINIQNYGILLVGDEIIICGAIEYLGIPGNILNGKHIVSAIINDNEFQIILPTINLCDEMNNTQGGEAVIILVPNIFRLLFNYPDTLGYILGWRNTGTSTSITKYSTTISNSDPYMQDVNTDSVGNSIIMTNNAIQLSGGNYVYMVADPLVTCYGNGIITNIFAKILLCDQPNKIIYNNFVNMNLVYDDPLYEITALDIAFYNQDGKLYNFYGAEHSYTLEIMTVNDIPSDTGISANTGKNYNIST